MALCQQRYIRWGLSCQDMTLSVEEHSSSVLFSTNCRLCCKHILLMACSEQCGNRLLHLSRGRLLGHGQMAPPGIPAPQHLLLLSLSKGVSVISMLQGHRQGQRSRMHHIATQHHLHAAPTTSCKGHACLQAMCGQALLTAALSARKASFASARRSCTLLRRAATLIMVSYTPAAVACRASVGSWAAALLHMLPRGRPLSTSAALPADSRSVSCLYKPR